MNRVSEKTGIRGENIVVAATHNHAVQEHSHDPPEEINYPTKLVDAWVEGIAKTHDARPPASIDMIVPQQLGRAFNRQFQMRDETVQFNPRLTAASVLDDNAFVELEELLVREIFANVGGHRVRVRVTTTSFG